MFDTEIQLGYPANQSPARRACIELPQRSGGSELDIPGDVGNDLHLFRVPFIPYYIRGATHYHHALHKIDPLQYFPPDPMDANIYGPNKAALRAKNYIQCLIFLSVNNLLDDTDPGRWLSCIESTMDMNKLATIYRAGSPYTKTLQGRSSAVPSVLWTYSLPKD